MRLARFPFRRWQARPGNVFPRQAAGAVAAAPAAERGAVRARPVKARRPDPAAGVLGNALVTVPGARCANGCPRSSLSDLPRLAAIVLLAGAFPAGAQTPPNCGLTKPVTDRLSGHYGETVQDVGLTAQGVLLQWWGNPETGTWTILATDAHGQSCVVLFGRDFERVETTRVPGVPG